MTYEDYVRDFVISLARERGSLRELSRETNVDVAILSKICGGKYIPKKKTFEKWFGPIEADFEMPPYEPKFILSKDLENLMQTLDALGYRIEIVKKET